VLVHCGHTLKTLLDRGTITLVEQNIEELFLRSDLPDLTAFLSHEEHALDDSETAKKEKNQQHVCPEYHHWGLSLARVSFLLASFVTCLLLQIE